MEQRALLLVSILASLAQYILVLHIQQQNIHMQMEVRNLLLIHMYDVMEVLRIVYLKYIILHILKLHLY